MKRHPNPPLYPDIPDSIKRLLVVDDDGGVLRTTAARLRGKGFEVETAASPEQALDVIGRVAPDLVLLDLHFDRNHLAEGLDCLRKLRAAGHFVPVVIWSGDDTMDMALEAARAGANGYLVKGGCGSDELVSLIGHLRKIGGEEMELLPASAEAYLRSRGATDWEISLLRAYAVDYGREKCVAARLKRSHGSVRMGLMSVRDRVGAKSQGDLCRILGVLSCFARMNEC